MRVYAVMASEGGWNGGSNEWVRRVYATEARALSAAAIYNTQDKLVTHNVKPLIIHE